MGNVVRRWAIGGTGLGWENLGGRADARSPSGDAGRWGGAFLRLTVDDFGSIPLLPGLPTGALKEPLSSLLLRLSLSGVVAPLSANACEGLLPFAIVKSL